jgi:hypothetical protein
MSLRSSPPFRADHVGSLLRTAPLKEAREARERRDICHRAEGGEDREIAAIIRKEDSALRPSPTASFGVRSELRFPRQA